MVRNFGISFGKQIPSLELISGGVWFLMLSWWLKTKNWRLMPILVGGALNWWERHQKGYIEDYWRIPYTQVYNNLNDWLIFIGVMLLLWQIIKKSK